MRIAFAIPYAGGSRAYLRRAIESVRAQTCVDWTLEIVDDSREPSDLALELAALGDGRISYRTNAAPHGIGHGWNACLRARASEFLTILHADDELKPDYAARMLALAERHPEAALYYCDVVVIDERGVPVFSLRDRFKRLVGPPGDEVVLRGAPAIARFMNGNFVLAPTVLYRRAAIAGRTFDPQYRFVIDLDFMLRTLFAEQTIVGTGRAYLRYRRHTEQQTAVLGRDTARMVEEVAFQRGLVRRFAGRGETRLALLARVRLSIRLSGIVTALGDARAGRFARCAAKLRLAFAP